MIYKNSNKNDTGPGPGKRISKNQPTKQKTDVLNPSMEKRV